MCHGVWVAYGDGMTTALRRPQTGKMIGGVCAAIAQRFGWDVTIVRVLTVASILLPGPQVLAYLVLWALIPREQ
ncbi:PspC domain-containing protein [Mycobacteroides salmoniphilum]|uniref:PspC domain-containing protein n=1 Tax=Mycobacteroides salmoniphilum TaxID=404941 RepID=UPI0010E8F7B2|nr:PspC domain-containing protein [Mycobacteroides salmoniphilum]TDZ81186.1 DNA-binding transcriptional activator PspC [Mycobacteroides salmoniphilum]TDZ88686.1 DNA-binding transcriptional activator PspC [Mycobacteroides salmoniphilum]